MPANSLLRVLADLAESSARQIPTDVVGEASNFKSLPFGGARRVLFSGEDEQDVYRAGRAKNDDVVAKMVAKDILHAHEQILRVGWLWFAGTCNVDGRKVTHFFPAASVPVTASRDIVFQLSNEIQLTAIGDVEISPLVTDPAIRSRLVQNIQMGGGALTEGSLMTQRPTKRLLDRLPKLRSWSDGVSDGAGLTVDEHLIYDMEDPFSRRKTWGIAAFYVFGLYIDRETSRHSRGDGLKELAHIDVGADTAFSKIYWPGSRPETPATEPVKHTSKVRPLSSRQVSVLEGARSSPISSITGAPGSGKSHVLASLAIDAIAEGKSVLVVAGSPHAVDVLVEHFRQTPGAVPVAFGGSRHGNRIASELLELRSRAEAYGGKTTDTEYRTLYATVFELIAAEPNAASFSTDSATRLRVLETLDRAGDLDDLAAMVSSANSGGLRGLLARRHRKRIAQRIGLDAFDGSAARTKLANLRRDDRARQLALVEGLELEPSLAKLLSLEQQHFIANGEQIIARRNAERPSSGDRIVGALATALRSDRSTRRQTLAKIPSEQLLEAAPLWVGAARDVGDVLPPTPGMFDVVIIDEASQLDQASAAHALVRARDAIVCGDSNQLGFVSFLSDDDVRSVTDQHQLDLAIDPRRQSVLDLAAAAGPTFQLTEHFRSAPHLIEFSSRRFYDGRVEVVTREPNNEAADHIDVQLVEDGTRGHNKVNHAEVEAVMTLLAQSVALGWRSIGVITPFRAQADAVEAAIIEAYRPEEIHKYGLRVGTVHGFQGDERDLLIMTWAIGADEGGSPWRFVNQRNLFNVMVTRARHHVIVVTSVEKPPGLAGEYIQWSVPLENLIDDAGSADLWVGEVASACRDAGIATRVGYPVGSHVIDLVLGSGESAIAVDCVAHIAGAEAHLDRALLLRRGGWKTADAYQSRWHDQVGELAIQLARRIDAGE